MALDETEREREVLTIFRSFWISLGSGRKTISLTQAGALCWQRGSRLVCALQVCSTYLPPPSSTRRLHAH